MPLPEPFRGEVWDVDFDDFEPHPAVVSSINALNGRLGHVAVVPVTGTQGPDQTHVPLGPDAGLTRYEESFADVTGLQPVVRGRLLDRRGLLAVAELDRLAHQLTITSSCTLLLTGGPPDSRLGWRTYRGGKLVLFGTSQSPNG